MHFAVSISSVTENVQHAASMENKIINHPSTRLTVPAFITYWTAYITHTHTNQVCPINHNKDAE